MTWIITYKLISTIVSLTLNTLQFWYPLPCEGISVEQFFGLLLPMWYAKRILEYIYSLNKQIPRRRKQCKPSCFPFSQNYQSYKLFLLLFWAEEVSNDRKFLSYWQIKGIVKVYWNNFWAGIQNRARKINIPYLW